MEIMSIIAILVSPAIAVWASMLLQKKKDVREDKMSVFRTLMATRNDRLDPENVRALNMIDFVFHDDSFVRKAWRDYYDLLNNNSYNDQNGWIHRDRQYRELLDTIAKALRYNINMGDIERTYTPQAFGDRQAVERELRDELLRLVKASASLGVPMKTSGGSNAETQ